MRTKNGTITQALGLEPVEGKDIYFQKVSKECEQASRQAAAVEDSTNNNFGIAGILTNVGERAKFYHFLDESPLSDYEKDLLFRGFSVGAAVGKAHIGTRLAEFMPSGLVKMILGIDESSKDDQ